MRVKGTAIVDLVKIIRSRPDRDWSRTLRPADLEIVRSLVLPTSYYPGDSFWRMSWAVISEIGGGSLDNAFSFGRRSAASYLKVYPRFVVPGDPGKTIENFVRVWETFYDCEGAPYEKMRVVPEPDGVRVIAHDYPDMTVPEVRVPYFHGLAGYFQEVAERTATGKRVRGAIDDDGRRFELTYRWS